MTNVTYNRNADTVTRTSVGKHGTMREDTSRAYACYRFTSASAANAASDFLNGMVPADADPGEVLKDAARDRRMYLHASEVAQVLADAQLRVIGSRPQGRHVAERLASWHGRGYIAVGDTVVCLPARALPSTRAIGNAAKKACERVPAVLVDTAHAAHVESVERRRAVRALRGPVKREAITA
jgi:hypothetical protein